MSSSNLNPALNEPSAVPPELHPVQTDNDAGQTYQQGTIPVNNSFEIDSAYDDGGDLASDTTSLRSIATNYVYENGRRYHSYRHGEYWGPNDEQMSDTLDIGHHIYCLLLDGHLYKAPIGDSPKRCLDVGTGTGIWAIDFADQFSGCQVTGTDLSPTQPTSVPPNCQFEVDDACKPWVFTRESFDFVHIRGMYGCVADWLGFYEQVLLHLKPGGWIEHVEFGVVPKSDDGTVMPDSIFAKWGKTSLEAGDAFGKSLRCVDENKGNLIAAGFEEVTEYRTRCRSAAGPKDKKQRDIGLYNRLQWEEGIEGWCMFLLTRHLGWRYEEVMLYVAEMRKMLRNKSVHAWHDCSVVIGRKPLQWTAPAGA